MNLCGKQSTHLTKNANPVVVPVRLSQNTVRLFKNANSDILRKQKYTNWLVNENSCVYAVEVNSAR